MKKIFMLSGVASLLMLSSCKKLYACECNVSLNGAVYYSASEYIHNTKKNAEKECEANADSTPSTSGAIVTCALKN